jgi:hypothetical protein
MEGIKIMMRQLANLNVLTWLGSDDLKVLVQNTVKTNVRSYFYHFVRTTEETNSNQSACCSSWRQSVRLGSEAKRSGSEHRAGLPCLESSYVCTTTGGCTALSVHHYKFEFMYCTRFNFENERVCRKWFS